ncbi:MAG: hypothetical protein LQ343_000873 [Gyalolechia ehrenbergii]|nr:MAG: hypothetical protein LQ343_000873 [Gyalolechia ehrenbergii]
MNSRFKQFGVSFGSKRNPNRNRDNNSTSTTTTNGSSITLSPPTNGVIPPPSNNTSSTTSLPMNQTQTGLGPPPSYTYNSNAPRTQSPMPPPAQQQMAHHPPPIHTGAYTQGHPALGGAAQPPGYGGGYGQPGGMHSAPQPTLGQYQARGAPVEVEAHNGQGTTFSGVAFAFATNTEAKEDIITEWPGAGNQTKQKIPTVLYYDQYQKVVGWGPDIADALAPTGYPKPGVQKVEWFKLQLMLSGNTYIDPINLPPLPPGKSEIDVAADYLFKLRQAMRNQLQKTLGEVFNREERNIRYFLTVPAIWNDAGKAATRAAAIQAGFLRDENDNRLTLITEPEAAAMFCSKTGLLNLKIRDAVLIVDCGGGTVDLIAYEVEEETPFTVAECTAGSGDSCGSTALNRNFSNILRAKIRKMKLPDASKTAGKVYAKCIMDFENRIKADFRNNGQKWAVDVGIEAEFPEAGIEEGYMTFTNEEILQCFEPVVNRILELVRSQIIAIQAQNRLLQNVLVVGGFGASEYLFQQIKLHVPPQFQSKVVRPMDSVAAIVKGAVTAGITERVITSRVARRHYLMATLQPFKEGHHPEQYRVPSLDGKDRCKYTRQIFVQKGQRVKIGEPVKVSFFRQVAPGATLMYEDILYACDEDVCPEYTKDPRIKEVVTLTSDLSRKNLEKDFERMDTPQGTFYRVYFDILLALDGICGIQRIIDPSANAPIINDTIPIAVQNIHHGVDIDAQITRLKTSSSASDREKEGFRLELHGLKHGGKKQKAVIEFLCPDKAEEEGPEERDLSSIPAKRKAVEHFVVEADDNDEDEEDHSATGKVADDGHGGILTYKGYDEVDESKVLRLEWETKYACENSQGNDSEAKKSNHWGFFTWLIIM